MFLGLYPNDGDEVGFNLQLNEARNNLESVFASSLTPRKSTDCDSSGMPL